MSKVKEFGFATQDQLTGKEAIRIAKLAEDLGYGTYWVPEDPHFRGPFVTAATMAAHTKTMRIGTCVVNPFKRHPVSIAQEMAALDDYSEGRAVLGIGSCNRTIIEDQLHIPFKKPLTALRESIDIIEQLIRGETVNYEGEVFKVSDVALSIPPYRQKIPLYPGVSRPKGLQFCGEYGDGLLISGMPFTEKTISYCMDNLKIGAEKNVRDISGFDFCCLMMLDMTDNNKEAGSRFKPLILTLLKLMTPGTNFYTGLPDSFFEKLNTWTGDPLDLITDDIVDMFVIAGSPERCKERIARLVDAGVTSFSLLDYTSYGISIDIEAQMRLFSEKVMSEFL